MGNRQNRKLSRKKCKNTILRNIFKRGKGMDLQPMHEQVVSPEPVAPQELAEDPTGRRIVSLTFLQNLMKISAEHAISHNCDKLRIQKETRKGFNSLFHLSCGSCAILPMIIQTDPEHPKKSLGINDAFTWGTVSGGGGYQACVEQATLLDIPCMSAKLFRKSELNVFNIQQQGLVAKMMQNGQLEREIAIKKGRLINGIPQISVTADGGWGKRSYGHSHNSLSGMGVIIGTETGGLLFLGIRNKFCYVCESQRKNINTDHVCFKNWTGSSTSMETDIIVEGFLSSLEMHGMYYTSLIADGDSSVGLRVQEAMLAKHNINVAKVECVNHAVTRLKSNLYKLIGQTKNYGLFARKTVKTKIARMGYYVTSAIIYNHQNVNGDSSTLTLANDIINIPYHTFGDHTKCRPYFCNPSGKNDTNLVVQLAKDNLWTHTLQHFNRTAGLSCSLILNQKNNASESIMALSAKYSGGKRKNIYMRHQYNLRTTMAGNSHRDGPISHYLTYKRVFLKSPNPIWKTKHLSSKLKSVKDSLRNRVRRKSFIEKNKESGEPDSSYGPDASILDIPIEILEPQINTFVANQALTPVEIKEIEIITRGQSRNETWHEKRRNLITSTKFHQILHKKDSTSVVKIVESIVYPKRSWGKNPPSIQHGLDYEDEARKYYETINTVRVELMGLVIHREGLLGASPDGSVVGNLNTNALLEIKCPFTAYQSKCTSIDSAVSLGLINFLEKTSTGITLKRTHTYYMQIVGQLAITGCSYCDLFVYIPAHIPSEPPLNITIRVHPDPQLWTQVKPELDRFFTQCIAPEILDPRKRRSRPLRATEFCVDKDVKATLNMLKTPRRQKFKNSNDGH